MKKRRPILFHQIAAWPRSRAGSTLLEVIMAAAMLAMLLATTLQMLRATSNHQRAAERRVVALQAVQAVTDQITNIPWQQLTSDSAKQMKIPQPLKVLLPGSMLTITVDEEPAPATAKRIHVELAWNSPDGNLGAPIRLTSWAFPERAR